MLRTLARSASLPRQWPDLHAAFPTRDLPAQHVIFTPRCQLKEKATMHDDARFFVALSCSGPTERVVF